jgi:hypothetical protein
MGGDAYVCGRASARAARSALAAFQMGAAVRLRTRTRL